MVEWFRCWTADQMSTKLEGAKRPRMRVQSAKPEGAKRPSQRAGMSASFLQVSLALTVCFFVPVKVATSKQSRKSITLIEHMKVID